MTTADPRGPDERDEERAAKENNIAALNRAINERDEALQRVRREVRRAERARTERDELREVVEKVQELSDMLDDRTRDMPAKLTPDSVAARLRALLPDTPTTDERSTT